MTEETIEDKVQVELEPKIGPGHNLREAREARKLTLDAVAKQLHIDSTLVRALEEDDYDKFAAPIFVTGNLRAYARILGLTPEPLIEAYQSLGTAAPPSLERVAHLSHPPEAVSSAEVPRWLVYVLVASVVAVVVLIWRSEATKLLAPLLEQPLMSESFSPEASRNTNTLALPGQSAGETPLPSVPLPDIEDNAAKASALAAPVAPSASVSVPAKTVPDVPKANLVLKAEKPSWVEVRDGSGNRLLYDLMVPGDTQSLEGAPPFDVLLGYAPGVIVEYNGKQVDHSAYTRQDMARFRVGDKGSSRN
jgi:cytoskeleton protein RodZ